MLRFRVLGPVEVRDALGAPVSLPRRKQRELFGLFVVRAGTTVPVAEIVDALWGEVPPPSARANLYSYVSGLRAALGPDERPRRTAGGYRLDLAPGECDLTAFRELAAEGRRALGEDRPARAVDVLTRGLALWRGPLLDGLDAGWLGPYAAGLEESRLGAVEDQVAAGMRLGRHEELVRDLAALTARYPLRERLLGLHLQALAGSGRRSEALLAYNRAAERLEAELGVEPGPDLRAMHRRLRSGPGPAPVDGGAGRPALLPAAIPDLTGRDREKVVLAAGLGFGPGDGPAGLGGGPGLGPAGLGGGPGLGPAGLGGGPGDGPRVAGVAGMAGVGKTALAVHVAHRLAGRYPDGILYADLHGTSCRPARPADVLAGFLRALGVPVPPDPADRAATFRTRLAGRRVLVVLDDADTEEQVRPLLPGPAGGDVLLTGRRPLAGLAGARMLTLDVLPVDRSVELLRRILDDDRVDRQPAAAARVARLCGGLPLALRIVGSRSSLRPAWDLAHVAGLLADERHRLDQLAVGDLDVRTSLALGQHRLTETARCVLRRCGLFDVPDFPGELAAAVLGGPADRADGPAAVEALVDAQLLLVAGVGAGGRLRYRLHELVRLHAVEEAERHDAPETRRAVLQRGWQLLAADCPARRATGTLPGVTLPWRSARTWQGTSG